MLQFGKHIVDLFQTISIKRDRLPVVANQRFNHVHLFGRGFIILLRGYARSLTPQTDSLFCKKTGTSHEYILSSTTSWRNVDNSQRQT